MNTLALAALLAVPARAQQAAPATPAAQGQRYVSGAVRGSLADRWDVQDYQGRVWLSVSSFGGSVSFSGRPFSGSLFGSGGSYSISAGGVSGNMNRFGNSVSVSASTFGPAGTRWLNFTMYVNGSTNNPDNPPSLSLFSSEASLTFSPTFRGYSVSGWVDDQRFGDEGFALACLASALVLKDAAPARAHALPKADWLLKSATVAPFLKTGFAR